ncbi:MAG TPA: hypothetical protein VGF40_03385 [Thermoanaerobaculia bacterium]
MRSRIISIVFVALIVFAAAGAFAQERFFVAPLRAGTLDVNLADVDRAFVVSRDGARRRGQEGAGSANRSYVTTAAGDYLGSDWTFEVTFETSPFAPDDILFIGLGEAVQDGLFFNEPRNSVNFRIHQGSAAFGTGWQVDVAAHDWGFLSFPFLTSAGQLPGPEGGTHIARIRKIGNRMSFEIVGTGVAAVIPDLAAAAPFLPYVPQRLFFGNASSAYAFRDVRVLPESIQLCP